MTVLDVWPNLIQNEGDNVGLYSQKEHITLVDGLFVTCCQVHSHFLQEKRKKRQGYLSRKLQMLRREEAGKDR